MITVPSRHETLSVLREAENDKQEQGGMPYLEGTGITISQFVNQAFDLEIKMYVPLLGGKLLCADSISPYDQVRSLFMAMNQRPSRKKTELANFWGPWATK